MERLTVYGIGGEGSIFLLNEAMLAADGSKFFVCGQKVRYRHGTAGKQGGSVTQRESVT